MEQASIRETAKRRRSGDTKDPVVDRTSKKQKNTTGNETGTMENKDFYMGQAAASANIIKENPFMKTLSLILISGGILGMGFKTLQINPMTRLAMYLNIMDDPTIMDQLKADTKLQLDEEHMLILNVLKYGLTKITQFRTDASYYFWKIRDMLSIRNNSFLQKLTEILIVFDFLMDGEATFPYEQHALEKWMEVQRMLLFKEFPPEILHRKMDHEGKWLTFWGVVEAAEADLKERESTYQTKLICRWVNEDIIYRKNSQKMMSLNEWVTTIAKEIAPSPVLRKLGEAKSIEALGNLLYIYGGDVITKRNVVCGPLQDWRQMEDQWASAMLREGPQRATSAPSRPLAASAPTPQIDNPTLELSFVPPPNTQYSATSSKKRDPHPIVKIKSFAEYMVSRIKDNEDIMELVTKLLEPTHTPQCIGSHTPPRHLSQGFEWESWSTDDDDWLLLGAKDDPMTVQDFAEEEEGVNDQEFGGGRNLSTKRGGRKKKVRSKRKKSKQTRKKSTRRKGKRKSKRTKQKKKQISSTLYYFSMKGCSYCLEFNPLWERLENKFKDNKTLVLKKLLREDYIEFTHKYGVTSYPTIILEQKKKKHTFKEERKYKNIINFLQKHKAI